MARLGDNLKGAASSNLNSGTTPTPVIFALVIAALYIGRDIFVPLSLAVLVSFLLAPLLSWLQRRHVPRIPAVVGVVSLTFLVVGVFSFVVGRQLTQLAENFPSYQSNLLTKIRAVKIGGAPDGLFGRISDMFEELSEEVARPSDSIDPSTLPSPNNVIPIPVDVVERELSPLQIVETVIGPMIPPLVTAGIVIVFVILILLYRQDLRDRFIRLVSIGDMTRTTQALEDAGSRVARYMLMQVVVNISYGIPICLGLWLIGVPYPLLWGLLAIVLRFIPYVGPMLVAIFPIALSIAVDPGWTMLAFTLSLFVVVELISNNIIEPWLYGANTGLSPIAIILSAIFWTWLWGPIGLLLATPLTVCLFVLGRHVPQFAFLDVLLGNERVLSAEESLHQRLLALNPDEATEDAEEYLETHSLEEFYNDVAFPALVAIERDRARGTLDENRRAMVVDSITALSDNLSDIKSQSVAIGEISGAEMEPLEVGLRGTALGRQVLCVGARGNLDDAAASILTLLVERRGFRARRQPWVDAAASANDLSRIELNGIDMVCLLYLNENSIAHARYLIRRLRRRTPGIPVLLAFLSLPSNPAAQENARKAAGADSIATSLSDTLEHISAALRIEAPVSDGVLSGKC